MPIKRLPKKDGQTNLLITADSDFLLSTKQKIVKRLSKDTKIPGFRAGKAPLNLIEKHLDQRQLTNEFLDAALSESYEAALKELDIKPISSPTVSVKKFVPFDQLEYEASLASFDDVKLTDYKKLKMATPKVEVSDQDIESVISRLRQREAERQPVERASQTGDEVVIDFSGHDSKGQPINGADGKDYPLILGSDSFIKGFEKNLVGLKAGAQKQFKLTFPKDYGLKALAGKRVTFKATVKKVHQLDLPVVGAAFIGKVSPFKTLAELRADIKKQLLAERTHQANRDQESQLMRQIINKSQIPAPASLVDHQIEHLLNAERQNLLYRGITLAEFLKNEGMSEEAYKNKVLKPTAEERVKGGLALSVIAEMENIFVTPEELETRINLLKGQYQDAAMQAELDKPDNRRDVFSQILTEKTLQKLLN